MRKIPFNIKYRDEIELKKFSVVTRDGRPVRIVDWDYDCLEGWPVVAIYGKKPGEVEEHIAHYPINGRRGTNDSNYDLFIITDDAEPTEFEKKLANILLDREYDGPTETEEQVELAEIEYETQAKRYSANLLVAAREELRKELPHWEQADVGFSTERYRVMGDYLVDESSQTKILIPSLRQLPTREKKGDSLV